MIPEEIIKGCIKKNRQSQRKLYEFCHAVIYPVAKRYSDTEDEMYDIISDSFLKIYNNVKILNTIEHLDAWMKRITSNTAIDMLRKKIKHRERNVYMEEDFLEYNQDEQNDSFAQMDFGAQEVFYCLSILPELQRIVFNMYVMDGYSHKDIADQLKISENYSRWNLYDAKKRLTKNLDIMVSRLSQ